MKRASKKSSLSRRSFLKVVSQTGGAAALGALSRPSFLMAQSAGKGKNVVVVNLAGGLDALAAYPIYSGNQLSLIQSARPTLAIDPSQVLSIDPQTGQSTKTGLHPEFQPLVQVAGNNMKIIQGYGIPNYDGRSHDTSQVIMSLGRTDVNDSQMKGFLARIMDNENWNPMQYFAFDVINPSDVNTSKQAPIRLNNLDDFGHRGTWWEDENMVNQSARLKQALAALQGGSSPLGTKYAAEVNLMHNAVSLVQGSIVNQAVGNNSAGDYTGEWGIGALLRDIAKVIRAKTQNQNLSFSGQNQIFYATHGGFDTHSDQANPNLPENGLGMRLRELATNLAVFWRDMQLFGTAEDTCIILYSEFGRTVFENDRNGRPTVGTDHGWGGNTLVIGGGVRSGVIGEPPSNSELTDQWFNALSARIDYRDIFAEVFSEMMDISPDSIFPDSSYTYQKLGIL